MSNDGKNNFDLDKFLNHLDMDEELAMAELSNPQRDRRQTFRKCPRCGSRAWKQLYADERGRPTCCNLCETSDQ